jgi:hypothetical protein
MGATGRCPRYHRHRGLPLIHAEPLALRGGRLAEEQEEP